MNRSQSSVSYSLQCLERQLNVMLFRRRNNILEITPEGVQLLDWAVSAFELLEDLKDTLSCASGELSGSVGVAGSMTILKQERVSNLIMEFMELHPRVQVSLRVGPPREALESIEIRHRGLRPACAGPQAGKVSGRASGNCALHSGDAEETRLRSGQDADQRTASPSAVCHLYGG